MSVIEAFRKYIKSCPLLQVNSQGKVKIGVDYLSGDTTTYSLEETPVNPVVKTYIGGKKLMQAVFVFASNEPYGPELQQQLSNSGFYEDFLEWIEENNDKEFLPLLRGNKEAKKVEVLTSGYVFYTGSDSARYQIQLRFLYYKN